MAQLISVPETNGNKISEGLGYILKYIKTRIDNNKNVMIVMCGGTGSGKSLGVLSIMELLFPDKSKEWIVDHVLFKPKDFLDSITNENAEPGEAFSFDESGIGQNAKQWQGLVNRMINFVLQSFRYKRLIVFFCLPSFSFLDSDTRKLVHGMFETKNIDRKNNLLFVKPKFIQTSSITSKMYLKYLRVKNKDKIIVPIRLVSIPKPSDELINLYQKKKESYTKDLYEDILDKVEQFDLKQQDAIRRDRRTTDWDLLTDKQKKYLEDYYELGHQGKAGARNNVSQNAIACAMSDISKKWKCNLKDVRDVYAKMFKKGKYAKESEENGLGK